MNQLASLLLGFFCLCLSPIVTAVELLNDFPDEIKANERYVFYSHGLIVEGDNPKPIHPEFGTYEFEMIKRAIFKDGNFNLIAHHRELNTNQHTYANQLATWVKQLIEAGVEPANITLIGFSRGAQITAEASTQLNQTGINTALMAFCFDGDYPMDPPLQFGGHVLSFYETSDVVKSCQKILDRSIAAKSTKEIAITTGKRHRAFYTPMSQWMVPLKNWLATLDALA